MWFCNAVVARTRTRHTANTQSFLILVCISCCLVEAHAFSVIAPSPSSMLSQSSSLLATQEASSESTATATTTTTTIKTTSEDEYPTYSDEELKRALDSLLDDSTNVTHDSRHMYGYGIPSNNNNNNNNDTNVDGHHKLSMLQKITATRILDYQSYMTNIHNEESSSSSSSSSSPPPSLESLEQDALAFAADHGPMVNLQHIIAAQAPRMALAAEFKRASPSKGMIASTTDIQAGDQAVKYTLAGANIISVLTEPKWFQGSLHDLTQVRLATNQLTSTTTTTTTTTTTNSSSRPAILRKEFIVNEYMIAEAAAHGADTVLLIVAVLPAHLLQRLITYCRETVGMEPLVEVHADEELQVALQAGAKVIGVNNRNLHTFEMDLDTTQHVAQLMTEQGKTFHHDTNHNNNNNDDDDDDDDGRTVSEYTICALSGMSTAMDVHRYRQIGVGMCLIGESLMRASDPQQAIRDLCLDPKDYETAIANNAGSGGGGGIGGAYTKGTQMIKVCGITNSDDALVACRAGANLIGIIFAPKSKRCVSSPEQAKAIVDTVRAFGERKSTISLSSSSSSSSSEQIMDPLVHLVSMAAKVEQVRRPLVVGVFQNQPTEFIQRMVTECGLDMVQLHGQEGMAACDVALTGGVPAIRVVDIETDVKTGKASSTAVDDLLSSLTTDPAAILLDTSIKGSKDGGGGTGVTFDWSIAEKIQALGLPVIIAGGLTPENVAQAVTSVRPWGIDVSSGVEASPGTKDHDMVKSFVSKAKTAAVESRKGF